MSLKSLTGEALEGVVLQSQYRLDKQVAKGGMAWLFRATHLRMQETIAVKILYPHLAEEDELRERFFHEARIQFKLRHAHIAQIIDIIDENGHCGMVMEWLNGDDLNRFLKRQPSLLPLPQVWQLLHPILQALQYTHEQDVVHRDIKPENILLHRQGNQLIPKLCDFGIAKMEDTFAGHKTVTGSVMGTPTYMSPEQIQDSKNIDHRADIYSFGVLLYKMVTGRAPFQGPPHKVTLQHITTPPPPPSEFNPALPASIERAIMRCLEKEPGARFEDCKELSFALAMAFASLQTTQPLVPHTNPNKKTDVIPLEAIEEFVRQAIEKHTNPPHHPNSPSYQSTNELTLPTPSTFAPKKDKPQADVQPFPQASLLVAPPKNNAPVIALGGVVLVLLAIIGFLLLRPPVTPTPSTNVQTNQQGTTTGCRDGEKASCYPGPQGTQAKGICKAGTKQCKNGVFGPCKGAQLPQSEACDGKDNNCDGQIDNLKPQTCTSACGPGVKRCTNGTWSPCALHNAPKELCDGKDNNCDGRVDETFEKKGQPCTSTFGTCRRKGTWICHRNQRALRCQSQPNKHPNHTYLRIQPSQLTLRIRIANRVIKAKNQTCIDTSSARKVLLKAPGYQVCEGQLPKRSQIQIQMKRSGGLLNPNPAHCIK